MPIISSSELGRTRKVFAAFGLLSSQGPARARLELEPGGPALAGPGPLHHHAGTVRQRLRPADVLHGLQHLRKQVVEMWPVRMLLSWDAYLNMEDLKVDGLGSRSHVLLLSLHHRRSQLVRPRERLL